VPVDIDRIVKTAAFYTGNKLQLAVFKFGTVVLLTNRTENIDASAKDILNQIYHSHPDFKPRLMDDGNYLVEYRLPAFTIVFKDKLEANRAYIDKNYMQGICTAEVLINKQGAQNVFDDTGKTCLFGRAQMFMDAQEPLVVKTFDPLQEI